MPFFPLGVSRQHIFFDQGGEFGVVPGRGFDEFFRPVHSFCVRQLVVAERGQAVRERPQIILQRRREGLVRLVRLVRPVP